MKKIFAILTVASAVFTMGSCEKYEDGRPPRQAINDFEAAYPDAFDIEWDYEGTYWEVSFETGTKPNGIEHTSRYDLSGNWIETVTEMIYNAVPQEIKDAFDAKYPGARVEGNVDYYQTPNGDFYRMEIYMNGAKLEVEISLAGKSSVQPSKLASSGFNEQIPPTDVWDVEWDFEGTYWEVSYETGTRPHGTEYSMYFDLEGNWLATKTELLLKDVPQEIKDALAASEYGTARLDDNEIAYVETAAKKFYRFEVIFNGMDAEVDVTVEGEVIFAGYDD